MSNYTIGNPVNLTSMLLTANEFSGGSLGVLILVVFLIINLTALMSWGFKRSLIVSLTNSIIVSIVMIPVGLLNGVGITFMLVAGLVGVVIWSFFSGS